MFFTVTVEPVNDALPDVGCVTPTTVKPPVTERLNELIVEFPSFLTIA